MATPRKRASRAQRFVNTDEVGRVTGVKPRKNVARDSAGFERPDDFFASGSEGESADELAGNLSTGNVFGLQDSSQVGRNRKDRPDKFVQMGEVGRRTGILPPPERRGSDGFEHVSDFFASSPSTMAPSTPKVYGKRNQSLGGRRMTVNSLEELDLNPNDIFRDTGGEYQSDQGQDRYESDDEMDITDLSRTPTYFNKTMMQKSVLEPGEEEVEDQEVLISSPRASPRRKSSERGKDRATGSPTQEDEGGQEQDVEVPFEFEDQHDEPEENTVQESSKSLKRKSKKVTPQHNGSQVVETAAQARKRQRRTSDDGGTRRSDRTKLPPLDYWRNERIVYKRRKSGLVIDQVIQIEPEYKGRPRKSKRKYARQTRTKEDVPSSDDEDEDAGYDDLTEEYTNVLLFNGDGKEEQKRIAFTAKMMNPQLSASKLFAFQKIYSEMDYLAAGIMVLPPKGEKPTKSAQDNSYVFYCISGTLLVTIHRTQFAMAKGGTFLVPRGNYYSFKSTSNKEVKLFFAQCRRTDTPEEAET